MSESGFQPALLGWPPELNGVITGDLAGDIWCPLVLNLGKSLSLLSGFQLGALGGQTKCPYY